MDMTGSRRIEAPRERVWEALNDPAVLQASIPGCESVERTGPDSFAAKVAVRIGPMSAKFGGKVTLSNVNPPAGYTITGEGQGGAMGFARGGADVSLVEEGPTTTTLNYNVKAQVGGKMAQLGARLVDSTARQMADQFFDRFAAQLAPAPATQTMTDSIAVPPTPTTASINTRANASAQAPATASGRDLGAMLAAIPRQPYGLPLNIWIGGAVMLVVLALLFVIG
ncbi:CoxG family protein [Roseomonas xinghualingensis]|uniref:CoxG family protein n=1 Tax=Roseomonas xinghualingensis TaxID=2986475 RepID=UPI0021F1F747|nr:carbon monoxide dehydrogenase subunit G [Roseomonas sp. SXEYE001]MCV4210045.1 carbon monoxide dehydrogenase subunit G [Roseomonas sp. SXEYE001]